MDQRVEDGQNVTNLDAKLQKLERFSTHVEGHNLYFKHEQTFSILYTQMVLYWINLHCNFYFVHKPQ